MVASSPGPKAETREWASQLRPRERVLPPPFRAGNARAGGHPRRERGHPCSVLQLARLSVPGEASQTPSGSVRPAAGCPLAQSSRHMKVTVTAGKLPVPQPGGPCPVLAVGSDEASSARFSHCHVPGESLGSSEEPPSDHSVPAEDRTAQGQTAGSVSRPPLGTASDSATESRTASPAAKGPFLLARPGTCCVVPVLCRRCTNTRVLLPQKTTHIRESKSGNVSRLRDEIQPRRRGEVLCSRSTDPPIHRSTVSISERAPGRLASITQGFFPGETRPAPAGLHVLLPSLVRQGWGVGDVLCSWRFVLNISARSKPRGGFVHVNVPRRGLNELARKRALTEHLSAGTFASDPWPPERQGTRLYC